MKHLSLFWYTTLQTLLWLKGRYIEALNFGIPRYKPYYGSRGGTLKHLSLFWYTTLQTLLWLKGRYIEALKFVLVYHVTNLIMDSRGGTLKHLTVVYHVTNLIMAQGEVH